MLSISWNGRNPNRLTAKIPANHLVFSKLRSTSATASPPSFIEPSGMTRWIVA